MLIALFATLALAFTDLPRVVPQPLQVPRRWQETGNRHARRRDRKLGRP